MLTNDNAESRQMIDNCYKRRKVVLNPIIDWTDEDVWEFIHTYNIPYCDLYDKGYKRLGCIGCPMSTNAAKELEAYPKFKRAYLRAFDEMLKVRIENGLKTEWSTAQEVMDWWLSK